MPLQGIPYADDEAVPVPRRRDGVGQPPPRPPGRRAGDGMSVAARLAGFAAILALVFAGAAFAGSLVDVHPGKPAGERADQSGMGAMADDGHGEKKMAPQAVRGLAVSEKGLTLELARNTAPQGQRFELAFRIVDRRGQTVRDFD